MNCSDVSVSALEVLCSSAAIKYSLVLISVPLIFLIILENSLVLLLWFIHEPLRTPQNAYFISLSVVDLLTGLFSFPLTAAYGFSSSWNFGLILCRMWNVSYFSFNAISAYHLVYIAADRYRSLTEGVSYLKRRSMASVTETLIVIWILGLWVSSPSLFDWENASVDPSAETQCFVRNTPYFVVHVWFSSYGFPAFLITRIYYKIFKKIKRRLGNTIKTESRKTSSAEDMEEGTIDDYSLTRLSVSVSGSRSRSVVEEVSETNKRIRLSRERRSAKTCAIIIGSFLTCWTPWYLLTLYDGIVPEHLELPPNVFMLTGIFGMANSCFNPIVYALRVPEFQSGLKKIRNYISDKFSRAR